MALKDSGRVTQLEGLSKTKIRGVLALLKHGDMLSTSGVDGQPVELLLSDGMTSYEKLRERHDAYLITFAAENRLSMPLELWWEIIWRKNDINKHRRIEAVNLFIEEMKEFYKDFIASSTSTMINSLSNDFAELTPQNEFHACDEEIHSGNAPPRRGSHGDLYSSPSFLTTKSLDAMKRTPDIPGGSRSSLPYHHRKRENQDHRVPSYFQEVQNLAPAFGGGWSNNFSGTSSAFVSQNRLQSMEPKGQSTPDLATGIAFSQKNPSLSLTAMRNILVYEATVNKLRGGDQLQALGKDKGRDDLAMNTDVSNGTDSNGSTVGSLESNAVGEMLIWASNKFLSQESQVDENGNKKCSETLVLDPVAAFATTYSPLRPIQDFNGPNIFQVTQCMYI